MKQLFSFPSAELLQKDTVYVTLVQELHATTLTNDKDRIQFENLISEAKKRISDSDLAEKKALLAQLDKALNNMESLIQYVGGLVVYLTPEDIFFYRLGISVTDRVFIDKTPYILPVAANAQYTRNYHLLVLNRESIRLFEGRGTQLEEIDLSEYENAPVDLETALGTEKEGGELSFGPSGAASAQSGQSGTTHFFGHHETSREKDIDRERYFRRVDDFVYNNFSNKLKYPLIVYSIEDNQSVFRNISHNNFLSKVMLKGSVADLSTTEIQKRVADKIKELNDLERETLLSQLKEVTPERRIENIPEDLAVTSLQGQIDTLFLQKDFEIPGTITADGRYDENDEKNNFIHLLVQNVLNAKGNVYVFEEEDMPAGTPIIATLRY